MTKNRQWVLFIAALLIGTWAQAQNFGIGFKTGLNYSTMIGPSEVDANNNDLETFAYENGYHLGAIFTYGLTDNFGVRGELMFSQKGMDYKYKGDSYWVYYAPNGDKVYHETGQREQRFFLRTSYIDVPLTAYGRLGKVEFSGGVNVGILVGAKGPGELKYGGDTAGDFVLPLEFNYRKDDVTSGVGEEPQITSVFGNDIQVPAEATAHYGAFGTTDNLYNALDFGLVGGVSVFVSKSLFIGLRANYGLSDVTKQEQDLSKHKLSTDKEFTTLDHKDQNLSFQLSIGFSL